MQLIWKALQSGTIPPSVQLQAQILLGCLALLWGLEIIDSVLLRGAFNSFGIRPRQIRGLWGILLAPLLHGNLKHLAANTMPFLILGGLLMLRGLNDFLVVTATAWVVSGIGVWLFASSRSNHIGASGVVFGYFGFLLLCGYFERSLVAIAISILVGLLYGSLIWGVLPIRRGVSWLGHLFGFGGGVLAARYLMELRNWVIYITH
ncbi:MAG: rhomboid family intramembrane serine protease [Oculatellaceae cyanobacterium bins.114]|nr:rhomboid family intramembrane serine protease [Oculatellaceae cyanobacterium bins.114]